MRRSLATRLSLVEYAEPVAAIETAVANSGLERAAVEALLSHAGQRTASMLGLPGNPITVASGRLRATDFAGLLRVAPRLGLEVAPKFLGNTWTRWREDFFFLAMLSAHGRLLASDRLSASSGDRGDLATLIGQSIVGMFWDSHRRPLRTYRRTRSVEFAVEGDVEAEELLLPPAEGYTQNVLLYDRQNPFNATILAAVKTLLPEVSDPQTRRRLGRVAEVLSPQSGTSRLRQRRVPGRARHWQGLVDLAVDVLDGFGVAYSTARLKAPGFVLGTWRVWQDLLTISLRVGFGSSSVRAQRSVVLGERVAFERDGSTVARRATVVPDLAVDHPHVILDAKYIGRHGESRTRISEGDLYEAIAFGLATKCKRVVLLYPAVPFDNAPPDLGRVQTFEEVTVEGTKVVGMEVEVRGISSVGGLRRFSKRLVEGVGLRTAGESAA
ncbi:MAG: restriction endonuclease [Myxococcus sp.]|nr:restriction endonuclease [Myxococcus sp.]